MKMNMGVVVGGPAIAAVVIVWGVVLALLWSALFLLSNIFGITLAAG